MILEVKVPSPGESIKQVQLANWLVKDGDSVEKDQEIAEIDTDKATLSLSAPVDGIIRILVAEGETIAVGAVVCTVEEGEFKHGDDVAPVVVEKSAGPPEPAPDVPENTKPAMPDNPAGANGSKHTMHITPLARKLMQENQLSEEEFTEFLKGMRISRQDVKEIIGLKAIAAPGVVSDKTVISREMDRKKMSTLRLKLADRLVKVKNQTAMLTTFNEVNMSNILEIKSKFNEKFKEKYGVSIGFMSFFTKAVTLALQEFPLVNSQIDGEDLLIPQYIDMGIAVSSQKGLVVPVIRNAETLNLAQIETAIKDLAGKARNNKLTIEEMTGGTFTITNGGVFGSMMSTPILNPPQSAILGMHSIIERPVALHGKVEIQPMMYVALSYDHRVIDGKESVSFLVRVKEILENPVRMLVSGADPVLTLLGL